MVVPNYTVISYIEWKHPFQQENNQNWFPVGDNKKVSFLIPSFYFPLGHILIGIQPTSQLCCISRVIWPSLSCNVTWNCFEVKPVLLLMKVCGQYGVNSGLSHSQEGCGFDPLGLGPFCVELAFSLWVIRLPPAFQKYAHETILGTLNCSDCECEWSFGPIPILVLTSALALNLHPLV